MNKDTGGPAFPELGNVGYNSDWQLDNGMTLRDYLAAKAMQGMCAHTDTWGISSQTNIAKTAYEIADKMLEERSK